MLKKIVLIASAAIMSAGATLAQQPCSTDEHYHELIKKYPELKVYEEQFNAQINDKYARKTAGLSDTTIYDIPLVVHVVHDYGPEFVSDDAIYEAVSYWATVYMKENADTVDVINPFKKYIGNPHMRLHLATKDPNGKATKGVVRHMSYLTGKADDQAKYESWPNNQYINVWLIKAFASPGAAAYAYYPSTAAGMPFYDGVISLYSYLNVQKTIPHELGHVLNLAHVWGSTNNAAVACGDDGVDDTPPTMGHSGTGCSSAALFDVTCAAGYERTYRSVLTGLMDSVVNYPDTVNSQNIMDYTYCEKMFTKGQVVRMQTALTSAVAGRSNLITPANLAATGALAPWKDIPPVAEFIVNKATGAGVTTDARNYFMTFNNIGSFVFKNFSWNDTISSVLWKFSNGATNPTSTSATIVSNQFTQPGWVTATLIANSNAGSDTLVDTHAVYAADTTAIKSDTFYQAFSSPAAVENWPMFNYYKNQFKWEFYNGAGLNDNTCIRYRSYDTSSRIFGLATGDYDDIYTPAFDLRNMNDGIYLNFFTSCAATSRGVSRWDDQTGDSMQVDVSTSGGVRWTKLAAFKTSDLVNNGTINTEFKPTAAGQWKPRAVSIPAAYRTGNTFFRIRYYPGNKGNNLYLDNMYIHPFPAGVKEAMAANAGSFNIFPNPTTNGCTLVFNTGTTGEVNYCVKDLTGKVIYQQSKTYGANSVQQESLGKEATPSAGMYFVTVTVDGVNTTQKLVVY